MIYMHMCCKSHFRLKLVLSAANGWGSVRASWFVTVCHIGLFRMCDFDLFRPKIALHFLKGVFPEVQCESLFPFQPTICMAGDLNLKSLVVATSGHAAISSGPTSGYEWTSL